VHIRQSEVFENAAAEDRAVLIGYLPAGFPTAVDSIRLMTAMTENGVDLLEVGLPYSDPLMDGPAIQYAVDAALSGGTTPSTVLDVVGELAQVGAVPLVMSYWNPIERYGVERWSQTFAERGGVGMITPDLSPEESAEWVEATDAAGIDRTYLVAPSSSLERIAVVCSATTGFLYASSTMGVTGVRTSVSSAAPELVARARGITSLPIGVGLGVSTREQAAEVAAYADGVIVGSAFVRAITEAPSIEAAEKAVAQLATDLAEGVRERR
jgi:tryptophan synthase alpha chain